MVSIHHGVKKHGFGWRERHPCEVVSIHQEVRDLAEDAGERHPCEVVSIHQLRGGGHPISDVCFLLDCWNLILSVANIVKWMRQPPLALLLNE